MAIKFFFIITYKLCIVYEKTQEVEWYRST